jgi:hypothetical protein
MSRSWGRYLKSTVVFAVAGAAIAPGCAKNDESIYIAGVLAPASTRTNGACSYSNDPTQARLFTSLLDVGVRDDYIAVILVANQMIPRGDPLAPRAESNRIHIDGAVIRVTDLNGNDLVPSYTTYSTGAVADPQNNNTPGFLSVGVPIIDGNTVNHFKTIIPQDRKTTQQVLVQIRAFGKTLGGVDVESGEYQHVMNICNGCIVNFPKGSSTTAPPMPADCKVPFDPTAAAGAQLPCFTGQDEPVNCQLCSQRPACQPP